MNKLKSKKLRVGILADGDIPGEGGVTIREYALYNELGTSKIPARPFFRTAVMFPEGKKALIKRIDLEIKQIINKGKTAEQSLDSLGIYAKGRIIKSLKKGDWAENAISTKKRKIKKDGSVKSPLVDSGSMVRAIDYEIKGG